MMDTKTLVVGQDVYIFDDCYNSDSGKVTKITPGFVEVTIKVSRIAPSFTPPGVELNIGDELILTFDRNGKGEERAIYSGWVWSLAYRRHALRGSHGFACRGRPAMARATKRTDTARRKECGSGEHLRFDHV